MSATSDALRWARMVEQLTRIADALEAIATTSAAPPTSGAADEFVVGDQAVADILNVTTRTVSNMVARGDLTRHKVAGVKGNRYLLSDVLAAVKPAAATR